MAQQTADQRQRRAARYRRAGEGVPQVVEAQAGDARRLDDGLPAFLISTRWPVRAGAGEDECRRAASAACRPARSRMRASSARAGADSGTSWCCFCLVLDGGFDQMPLREIDVGPARRQRPRRASRPSEAAAGRRPPPAGPGARRAPPPAAPARRLTGSAAGGARCCARCPSPDWSRACPSASPRLNIFDISATDRLARNVAPLLVILRCSASTSAKVTSATLACGPKCGRTCLRERAAVVARGGWPLARQVFLLEPVDQLGDGRRGALGLDLGQRVAAIVDEPPQLAHLGPPRRRGPLRKPADGVGAVAAGARVVVEHE